MTHLLDATTRRLHARAALAQRDGRLPSLVVGVVRDGTLAWSSGHGDVDEPHEDVQYRLGSITKTLTAIAILQLRDAGRLRLNDPVEKHLPATPFAAATIGQLLAHNAGVRAESPTQWWERSPGLAWPELSKRLTADDTPHAPGRRFHYSNLGYGVLGEILARAHDQPWADVVRDQVLLPLGMTRTTPRPDGRAARGWAVHPWADALLAEPEHDAVSLAPAGQLWATLTDLGRLAAFLLGNTGEVLDPDTLAEMAVPAGVDDSSPGWSAYGLGLQVIRLGEQTLTGHGGSMPGFLASVLVDREQDLGTVLLCNATGGLGPTVVPDLHEIVRTAEPRVVTPWSPLPKVDQELLALVGVWYWGTYGYGLRLSVDGLLRLAGLTAPGRASRFRGRADGSWLGLDGYHAGEVLTVVRDDAGTVVALDLGSFVYSRTPYDAAVPIPGGVDAQGWRGSAG